jgi:hypothetical protein
MRLAFCPTNDRSYIRAVSDILAFGRSAEKLEQIRVNKMRMALPRGLEPLFSP